LKKANALFDAKFFRYLSVQKVKIEFVVKETFVAYIIENAQLSE